MAASRARSQKIATEPGAGTLAEAGFSTGASVRNWEGYAGEVTLPAGLSDWHRGLPCDPQTSDGLLIAIAPEGADVLVEHIRAAGFSKIAAVGTLETGAPGVVVV